ncbi:MAG: HNH endonuclease [Cytophagales bacterium]|nr:HNH endonuclease [Cytophagales bacterium]
MTTKKKSTKIPPKTEAEVMFKSNLQCCVCQKKGDHIHHLDSVRTNNDFDNLALLCFKHHNFATIKGSLSKKLSRQAIIKFREHHYQVIENERQKTLGALNNPIIELNEEALLTASKNAIIIIEIEKIKEEYFSANWDKREKIIGQLNKFSNHSNFRIAFEVFEFLSEAAGQTRGGMTYNMATSIFGTALDFSPSLHDEEKREQAIQIAKQCIHIGDNIAYDAFIHLRNLAVAMWGLTIIKFIYRKAKENNIQELKDEINRTYKELEATLRRPERTDLENAQEMLKVFKDDLDEWSLSFPPLPNRLMKIIDTDNKK